MVTPIYAMPNSTDTTGFYSLFRYVNTLTEGLFFPVTLLAVFIITFISLLSSGLERFSSASRAWTFSAFFCSILAIMLSVLNLLTPRYMYLCILALGFGIVWTVLENSKD